MEIREYYVCSSLEVADGRCFQVPLPDGWSPLELFELDGSIYLAAVVNRLAPVETESVWAYLTGGELARDWADGYQPHYLNMVPVNGCPVYFFLELPPEGPTRFDGRNPPPILPKR